MPRSLTSAFAAGLLALVPSVTFAHSLWIEELPNGQLCVRFAQWGDDYEKSPGNLDPFVQVTGWAPDAEGKPALFDVEKKSDQFFLGKADATKPAFAQARFIVRQLHKDKPARAPIFYCRYQPNINVAAEPTTDMDIVPTGKPGEARVYFRGKPLADTEVFFFNPAFEEKKLKSDAEGFVRITEADAAKPGPYLLAVARYSEDLPGYFLGVPFAITSHSASLSWTVKAK